MTTRHFQLRHGIEEDKRANPNQFIATVISPIVAALLSLTPIEAKLSDSKSLSALFIPPAIEPMLMVGPRAPPRNGAAHDAFDAPPSFRCGTRALDAERAIDDAPPPAIAARPTAASVVADVTPQGAGSRNWSRGREDGGEKGCPLRVDG